MTEEKLRGILSNISFRDWWFEVQNKGDGFLMQAVFMGPDTITGKVEEQRCRKWYISSHAVDGEVVRTAWKAIEAAVVHEAAEEFYYKATRIYDPHRDPEALINIVAQDRRVDDRPVPDEDVGSRS